MKKNEIFVNPFCDLGYPLKTKEERLADTFREINDVQLLKEFRKRFNNSVLEAGSVNVILSTIGLKLIKRYLDECDLKVIKKPKNK